MVWISVKRFEPGQVVQTPAQENVSEKKKVQKKENKTDEVAQKVAAKSSSAEVVSIGKEDGMEKSGDDIVPDTRVSTVLQEDH